MKLLDRWRIARCVEEGWDLPPALARRVGASRELSGYCSNLRLLERSLRNGAPAVHTAPPGLAAGIVERLGRHEAVGVEPARRWRPVAGATLAAVLLCGGVFVAMKPVAPGPAATAFRPSWPDTSAITRTPVEGPLVREARLLARDTRRAADMVLASFPSGRSAAR